VPDSPGRLLSRAVGWLADRGVPRPLRKPVYGAYGRLTGADPSEAELGVAAYPSLGAFFVRRLRAGARAIDRDPAVLPSPCDGTVQAVDPVTEGSVLQAKGRPYTLAELCGGANAARDYDGGHAWTIYLSPRDYHRVHAPEDGELFEVRWIPGARWSVAPKVLARRPKVLSINERAVLRFRSARGPWTLVMVGALNVGRIRVVGDEPGRRPAAPTPFARGAELARLGMGSTVILIVPRDLGFGPSSLAHGAEVGLGRAIGARD
jgi:phosphatidylserine decarboxylase